MRMCARPTLHARPATGRAWRGPRPRRAIYGNAHTDICTPARPGMAAVALEESVEIEGDEGDDLVLPTEYDIIASPVDYPLETLRRKMGMHEVVLPTFQRGYVWDRIMASRLIESFVVGLPVPPVFLLEETDKRLLVIDGLQRLETLRRFFSEEFAGDRTAEGARRFRLAGVSPDSRLHGRTFSELDPADRRTLENTVLRAIIVRQMDPDKNIDVAHDIFERLNTGGMRLRDQEVRNCIHSGKLNDLINELNSLDEWRKILKSPRPDKHQKDAELILRYMALFHDVDGYRKPMKSFLSAYMRKNRDPSDAFISEERTRFARTCRLVLDNLGGIPLNKNNRISPPVFDAIFVALARGLDGCDGGALPARLRRLMDDPSFIECTTRATTDPCTVRERLSLAMGRLCG